MKSILFTNAKLKGQNGLQDIYITDGKFKEIGPGLAAKVTAEKVVDLEGKLAVPPYVDPHIHLDYVFTALNPAAANKTGSLFEGIQRWSETKGRLTKEEIKERARQAMKQEILTGVQYIRTHVDVTDPKLTALQAMLDNSPYTNKGTNIVRLTSFGDSSINILISAYLTTNVYATFLQQQNDLNLNIMDVMQADGVDFAFPSTSVYIEKN